MMNSRGVVAHAAQTKEWHRQCTHQHQGVDPTCSVWNGTGSAHTITRVSIRSRALSPQRVYTTLLDYYTTTTLFRPRARPPTQVYTTPGGSAAAVSPQAGVLKTDVEDVSRSQIWLPEPHQFCGEVLFTPRPAGSAEDDGYLLTLCFDGKEGTSSLLVLDAAHVDRGPIARVPLSAATDAAGAQWLEDGAAISGPGHGLHATWVSGLAPSLGQVQSAEASRGIRNARFLSDAPAAPRA